MAGICLQSHLGEVHTGLVGAGPLVGVAGSGARRGLRVGLTVDPQLALGGEADVIDHQLGFERIIYPDFSL